MTGHRKYRFALASLAALVIATVSVVWARIGADVFHEFVLGLFLLNAAFGGTNGIEHVASALRRDKEAKP